MDQVRTKNITTVYQTYRVHNSEGTTADQGLGWSFDFREAPYNDWAVPAVILSIGQRKVTSASCIHNDTSYVLFAMTCSIGGVRTVLRVRKWWQLTYRHKYAGFRDGWC